MKEIYVLDACAMLTLLSNEPGADKVERIYEKANLNEIILAINKLNFFEVYYNSLRSYGKKRAGEIIDDIKNSPIRIYNEITDEVFMEAGRLKTSYKMSLADSIALAQTLVLGGKLVTADHHEFDIVEKQEKIEFFWIR